MRKAAHGFYLACFALLGEPHKALVSGQPHGQKDVCAIDPKAIVSDACASFHTLDTLNAQLQPAIESLTRNTDFFSYYRLNLYNRVCPFWSDESSMCGNIACAVDTIDDEEDIPLIWRAEELGKLQGPKAQHPDRQKQREQRPLMGGLGENIGESCVVEYDDECDERDYCVPEDEGATTKGDYVSLVDNPERFTGYAGPSARQVWDAIYRENCFSTTEGMDKTSAQYSSSFARSVAPQAGKAAQDLRSVMRQPSKLVPGSPANSNAGTEDPMDIDDQCLEKRVFYRVISGMHASISTHLCWDYLNKTTGSWGPNLQCFEDRLHDHPDRISNLYFNYALVLRAIAKLRSTLQDYTFCSGDPVQDRETKEQVLRLADKVSSGPRIYDESLMFQDPNVDGLKDDFRVRFRNVSRTMDCVGCDKCRLWGKLQTAGYGTALKVLFEFDENGEKENPPLRRTELVALVNTLDKISHSLSALEKFKTMHIEERRLHSPHQHGARLAQSQDEENGPRDGEHDKKTNPESVGDIFWDEMGNIWRTTLWVLRQWYNLPWSLSEMFLIELNRLWNFWLGLPVASRTWEIQYVSHDEI